MKTNNIIQIISNAGMIDYAIFKDEKVLKQIPKILDELLKEAKKNFQALLKMPEDNVNFESFMDHFFTSDQTLSNLFKAIDSYNGTNSSATTRKIIADFQPKLVAYHNEVSLSEKLYKKLKTIQKQKLNPLQKRSLKLVIRDLEVAGVHTSEKTRNRLKQINEKLSELSEKFSNNAVDSKGEFFYAVKDKACVSEMPEADLELAKQEAKKRKSKAPYVFTLSPPSYLAIMRYCSDEAIREKFYKASNQVATKGKNDNRPLALKLLQLREEKAKLLGFKNYADYVLQERMAPSSKEVIKRLKEVNKVAGKEARKNIQELRKFSGKKTLANWDISYYSEKLKQKRYQVDDKMLKPYFSLEAVLEGLFAFVKQLFELELKPIKVKPYAEGARAYEVYRKGKLISYYLLDAYTRTEKRAGAWANDLRSGFIDSKGKGVLPVVINVCNFPTPSKTSPALLSHRDVETIFHEFGHALHVMLSSHTLANLNGFHTEWDFVEAPSQILENWCWEYDLLKKFAKHYKTGKSVPKTLIEKLHETKNFMSGLFLIRQNEFGFLDYLLHSEKAPKTVRELDEKCLKICQKYSVLEKFRDYRMYCAFTHIFAGGYSAGYYSYMWAEILEADMFQKMKQLGVLSKKAGRLYADKILIPGTQKPAMDLFMDFVGRKPNIKALFKKHGIKA